MSHPIAVRDDSNPFRADPTGRAPSLEEADVSELNGKVAEHLILVADLPIGHQDQRSVPILRRGRLQQPQSLPQRRVARVPMPARSSGGTRLAASSCRIGSTRMVMEFPLD